MLVSDVISSLLPCITFSSLLASSFAGQLFPESTDACLFFMALYNTAFPTVLTVPETVGTRQPLTTPKIPPAIPFSLL